VIEAKTDTIEAEKQGLLQRVSRLIRLVPYHLTVGIEVRRGNDTPAGQAQLAFPGRDLEHGSPRGGLTGSHFAGKDPMTARLS
jgi:hypothetical protein